jgi:hypothetical protein
LQLGDAVCRTSQAGVFAGFAGPLAPRDFVSFFTPIELIGVLSEVVSLGNVVAFWSSQ